MPDQNDLNKPDLGSSYNNEVLETLRGHIARLWTGTWGSMAGVVNGMLRWEIPGGNVLKLWRRNGSGTDDLVFDSTSLLGDGTVTTPKLANGVLSADAAGRAKMADGFSTYAKLGSNVTPILTGRNKIINGAIKVDQRNAGGSRTFTAGAALAYCVDRWYGYCTGANITGQRIALSNAQNRFRFTGAASNTGLGFGQRIEAVNSMDLAGGTATLSVKLSSSSLTSITWTAFYANTTDAFGTLASPTRTQIATGTFTINSTEATYSTNISVPSAATTGIEIVFTGGALLATQTLTIGDAQLEVGSVATPFEHRSFGTELTLCQRYFCKTFDYGTAPAQNLGTNGSINFVSQAAQIWDAMWRFPVEMRVTPTTVTTFSTNAASANWSTNTDTPTASVSVIGAAGLSIRASTPGAAGRAYFIHATASAEL